jgi:hypothetical protein
MIVIILVLLYLVDKFAITQRSREVNNNGVRIFYKIVHFFGTKWSISNRSRIANTRPTRACVFGECIRRKRKPYITCPRDTFLPQYRVRYIVLSSQCINSFHTTPIVNVKNTHYECYSQISRFLRSKQF